LTLIYLLTYGLPFLLVLINISVTVGYLDKYYDPTGKLLNIYFFFQTAHVQGLRVKQLKTQLPHISVRHHLHISLLKPKAIPCEILNVVFSACSHSSYWHFPFYLNDLLQPLNYLYIHNSSF